MDRAVFTGPRVSRCSKPSFSLPLSANQKAVCPETFALRRKEGCKVALEECSTDLELAGIVSQFDLQQEAVLSHLVLRLVLQLLDQAVEQPFGLELLLRVLQVYGIPAHTRTDQTGYKYSHTSHVLKYDS